MLLSHQLLSCFRRSDSGKCHSPLSESLERALINSCFHLPLAQIPAETPVSIHDSPFPADDQDTVATFPAPPDPTGKVYCPLQTLIHVHLLTVLTVFLCIMFVSLTILRNWVIQNWFCSYRRIPWQKTESKKKAESAGDDWRYTKGHLNPYYNL